MPRSRQPGPRAGLGHRARAGPADRLLPQPRRRAHLRQPLGGCRTALPSNNSSIQATRLASGAIALPYNAYSAGDGFCGEANEQLNRRCAYPSILQTGDGAIHIAYSYRGRRCIKYVRVDEQWIRAGLDAVYRGPGDSVQEDAPPPARR